MSICVFACATRSRTSAPTSKNLSILSGPNLKPVFSLRASYYLLVGCLQISAQVYSCIHLLVSCLYTHVYTYSFVYLCQSFFGLLFLSLIINP